MSRSSSPPSPISDDEKPHALPEITDPNVNTESGRLHALEQLEILPQILNEGILFAGSGAALLLQAAFPGIKSSEEENNKDLATELLDFLQEHISQISGVANVEIGGQQKPAVRIQVDPATAASWVFARLEAAGGKIHRAADPCLLPKACKNPVEIDGTRAAHRRARPRAFR